MEPPILHCAPWIVPVSGPVLANGCIVVRAGRIMETGTRDQLLPRYPGAALHDHDDCALCPGLVNAHIHLELSHLRIPELRPEVAGFTDWIATLLDLRAREDLADEGAAAARQVLRQQYAEGVIALGDIGNTDLGTRLAVDFPGTLLHFREFLGRSQKTRRTVQMVLDQAPDNRFCTAHAPYSTHPELIRALKARARRIGHCFPIHVAEPAAEAEMLSRGSGELFSFLDSRNFLEHPYRPPARIDNPGSVRYLHELGVLDRRTMCVHCVHVSQAEALILADSGSCVCLCPGSNRYLKVGTAPAGLFRAHGILPALGTDSTASNPELSLWREMRLLAEDHPALDPAEIFAMATLGGALALDLDQDYGSLAPGRSARLLAIPLPGGCASEKQLYNLLVCGNHHLQPTWIYEQ